MLEIERRERDARIAQLYRIGWKYWQIAEDVDCSVPTVKTVLNRLTRNGTIKRRYARGEGISGRETQVIIKMYQSGASNSEMVKALNKSAFAISQKLKALILNGDIERRDSEVDTGKLMALYRAGWCVPKIAEELGLTEKQITRMINERKEEKQ